MKRLPSGRYSKEFREEAVKLVKEDGLSVVEECSLVFHLRNPLLRHG